MNLKSHTITLKLKRAVIGLASVLLAICLSILPINLTASAVNIVDSTNTTTYVLPFPSPDSFGDSAQSVVLYNSTLNRFTMFVLTYDLGVTVGNSTVVSFDVKLKVNPNDNSVFNYVDFFITATVNNSSATVDGSDLVNIATCKLYRFNWGVGVNTYSVASVPLTGNFTPNICYRTSNKVVYGLSYTYGNSSLPYDWSTKHTYSYNGANVNTFVSSNIAYSFSTSDGGQILSILNGMSTTLDSVDTGIDNVNNKLNSTNDLLNAVNNNVSFYCQQILDRLDNGNDYVPEQTTSNSDMSNYEQAEGALMDDNIDKLNNIQMPDLNSFNSGSQNNAFKFISSNIEFFSGMNGTGSVSKIATVLVVILGLGLASFIIGLSNRKKGG